MVAAEEVKVPHAPHVAEAMLAHVRAVDHNVCAAGDEDSFFVADLGEVRRNLRLWRKLLPRVQPHYAVKCNPDPAVLRLLGRHGAGFDCASKAEMDLVLLLGFDPALVVYANPCKTPSFLRHARDVGVLLTTVDNAHEVDKIKAHHPRCRVLIRLATDDATAQCRLLTKFGCSVETATAVLLPRCAALGVDVVGVAFHVGSGARDFGSIAAAVRDARAVFDAAALQGLQLSVLDIGGGFEVALFAELSAVVRRALAEHFPHDVRIIAEPGRFMVALAFTLAAHVIARRDTGAGEAMLYINDGVYGNMNCILFDHQLPQAEVLTGRRGALVASIWGPTCDGLDCVAQRVRLDHDVAVGDWLCFANMGAYTAAATTSFNGFSGGARVLYVDGDGCGGAEKWREEVVEEEG